jgi:hypothetical protein
MLTLPRQFLVGQQLVSQPLDDPAAEVAARLLVLDNEDWKGKQVAVGLGSRGIDRIQLVARTVVEWLRARGAEPFIFPAMGSHGGGTPNGQIELLASYDITEATVGAPIRAAMETDEIGVTASGIRVRGSRVARDADAIILVNRVKPHTDFSGVEIGSGLRKMSAIGLGKADGAFACHLAASRIGFENVFREVSAVVVSSFPRLYGVALLEDGTHHLARIEVLRGVEFAAREPELYAQARAWMPALPFAQCDVLVVDEIGKNYSGTGMDTNITGRGVRLERMATSRTEVRAIYVRGLSAESHGNAIGIGLADIVHSRLVDQMDPEITYMNALSAMTPCPPRISINFRTDEACLRAALRVAGVQAAEARILRIRNTLAMSQVVASDHYLPEIAGRSDLQVLAPVQSWDFAPDGNLEPRTDLLAAVAAH